MKQSTARPPSGDLDFSKLAPKRSGAAPAKKAVYDTSTYTARLREEDPWPDEEFSSTSKTTKLELSSCRFTGPVAEMHFNQPTPVQCDYRLLESTWPANIEFKLQFRYLDTDAWADLPSRASATTTGETGTVTAQIQLDSPKGVEESGKLVQYRVVASSTSTVRPEESPKVDLKYKVLVPYVGTPEITHPADSHLPTIGAHNEFGRAMATLLQKLSTYPPGNSDMAISFGFASADAVGGSRKFADVRARAIKAILRRDVAAWKELGKTEFKLRDIQYLLSELAKNHNWNCDPGKVDGASGPSTSAALNGFQKECNHRFKTSYSIDGKLGGQTWEGALKVYCSMVRAARGEDPSAAADWPLPDFPASGTQGTYSNGNDFPDPPGRSAEICLFHPVDVPALASPPASGAVTKAENPVEDPEKFEKRKLDLVKDPDEPSPDRKVLHFLHDNSKLRKQYVNLGGKPEFGHVVELEVEVDPGVRVVHWKAIAAKGNSKRNSPVVGWIDDGKKTPTPMSGGSATWTSPASGGKAKAKFCVGLAGGDEFTIEVGPSAGVCDIRQKIVNWRRLWYTLTYGKGSKVPSMALSQNKARDVFIELVAETPIVHELFPAGKVYVGNHNFNELGKLFHPVHAGKCLQVIVCDLQVDGAGSPQLNAKFPMTTQSLDIELRDYDAPLIVLNPPVVKGAPLIIDSSWKNLETGAKGKFTSDPTLRTSTIGLLSSRPEPGLFTLELPAGAISAGQHVETALSLTAAKGPYCGDGSNAPQILIKFSSDARVISGTIIHEMGHLINMVPYPGYYHAPPGLRVDAHPFRYDKHGGSGSHCSYKAKKGVDDDGDPTFENGHCVMFHADAPTVPADFCPTCATFVKAQSLTAFKDLKG
ncbi:MAG: peptidoglycan-binding protein [Fibrobacteres bacterium]|nr:peptidoglycan-binding protein [Fibrobacterota bacterium]